MKNLKCFVCKKDSKSGDYTAVEISKLNNKIVPICRDCMSDIYWQEEAMSAGTFEKQTDGSYKLLTDRSHRW